MLNRKHVYTWLTVLLLSCLSHVWAQSNINIVNNNITIRAALYEIEKQSGYSVGFDETDLDVDKKLSVSIRSLSLEDALKQILKNENCSYTIKQKHIIIVSKQKKESELAQHNVVAQQKTVQ